VRDDREGAPARDLVGRGGHQSASAVARHRPLLASDTAARPLAVDVMAARPFANGGPDLLRGARPGFDDALDYNRKLNRFLSVAESAA
jgi:hypothetical protein